MSNSSRILLARAVGLLFLGAAFLGQTGCGGGSSSPDAGVFDTPGSVADAASASDLAPPVDLPLSASLFCTAKPALATVTDLSGTWVERLAGSQTVNTGIAGILHPKSVFYILTTIRQTGTTVVADGHYCDRTEIDSPGTSVPVIIPDQWAHTETPISRTGSFSPAGDGTLVLGFPAPGLQPLVEVIGAVLASPTDDLPTSASDPRVIDEDGDGHPGITVNLSGLSIQGSLYSVQKQTTSVQAIAVAPDRVEGMLTFSSVQTVLASSPASLATLYAMSTTSPDLVACDSTFAMVKVSDSTSSIAVAGDGGLLDASAADGGTIGCDWVRANEALLFPPN